MLGSEGNREIGGVQGFSDKRAVGLLWGCTGGISEVNICNPVAVGYRLQAQQWLQVVGGGKWWIG